MIPKLNKWHKLNTRFKIVKSDVQENLNAKQYRLVIEFPVKYRRGWFPFELTLQEGNGCTNYWCNPFGVAEIKDVLQALSLIQIRISDNLNLKLRKIKYKLDRPPKLYFPDGTSHKREGVK